MMMLRPLSPNCPAGGITNAPVLNHWLIDGFEIEMASPGTRFARSVPLVPRATSAKFPSTFAVNGNPDAMVKVPLHVQSPRTLFSGPGEVIHLRPSPKGRSTV